MKTNENEMIYDPGARLRQLRKAAGLYQYQLAAKADLAPSLVSLIETRQFVPQNRHLEGLARALGVKPRDILYVPKDADDDDA